MRALAVIAMLALLGCAPGPHAGGSRAPTISATASATPPAPTPTPAPTPRSITITLTGDLLWHADLMASMRADAKRNNLSAEFDYDPLLAGLKRTISAADLSVCHEEVPFAKPGGPYTAFPVFAAPPESAVAIAQLGFDLCTTASNHSIDGGLAGLSRTLEGLRAQGIRTVGTYLSPAEAATPVIVEVKGVKVAVVSGTYHLNGFKLPPDKPWAVDMLDPQTMIAKAEQARAAGADIVLAHMHAGTEYASMPDQQQQAVAAALAGSDAIDLIYGQGAHVVQPITKVNGKWVVYGHGDLVSTGRVTVPRNCDGMITRFTFTGTPGKRFEVTQAEYLPTVVSQVGGKLQTRVLVVSEALPGATGALRERLLLGQQRTTSAATALKVAGIRQA